MLLIADSGSTKCDWILYKNKGKEPFRIRTKGLNPSILKKKSLKKIITNNVELYGYKNQVKTIYFFGAGCSTKKNKKIIDNLLVSFFENAKSIVEEDLMAAVWATTNRPAVVCILGTGSNCCYYDGNIIHKKTPSLGHLVMDEGSGNYFGKELLKSYYYKQLPDELRFSFERSFNLQLRPINIWQILLNFYLKIKNILLFPY